MNVSNIVDNISYNYIEFYQDTISDYYQMEIKSDNDFLSMSAADPFVAGNYARQKSISPIPVDIDMI